MNLGTERNEHDSRRPPEPLSVEELARQAIRNEANIRLRQAAALRRAKKRSAGQEALAADIEAEGRAMRDFCEPNNRPADGRVCDCEDAPCCGHYEQ